MKKKKKRVVSEPVDCVLYLSTEGDLWHAEEREQKQQRYVLEYCKAHGINVVKTMNRDVCGQAGVNRDFSKMVEMIRRKKAQGIVVANMKCISSSLPDAYYKIGMVVQAGGKMFTVDDGNDLSMDVKGFGEDE